MVSTIAQLPNGPLILKQHLVKQQVLLQEKDAHLIAQEAVLKDKEAALKNKDTTLRLLEERLRGLLHKRFGVSSEQASDQFNLFDEAEATLAKASAEVDATTIEVPAHRRQKPGRKALPRPRPTHRGSRDRSIHSRRLARPTARHRIRVFAHGRAYAAGGQDARSGRSDRQLVISSDRLLRWIGVDAPAPIRGIPGLFSSTGQKNDPYQAVQGLDPLSAALTHYRVRVRLGWKGALEFLCFAWTGGAKLSFHGRMRKC